MNKPALALKHRLMDQNPFLFLRATFYRWLQLWSETCPGLLDGVEIDAVGDLHVENFGTWRDSEGRLVWGINDVDEACVLPYTQDLTRLATGAVLAKRIGRFAVSRADICESILTGYRWGLAAGGNPIVLAEHRPWLRDLAVAEMENPRLFWKTVTSLKIARTGAPLEVLESSLPKGVDYRVFTKTAGAGSLGRPRFVALATWDGGFIAREAKARVPSAVAWLHDPKWTPVDGSALLGQATRARDPFFATASKWSVRRLSPDCTSINLADMPKRRDERRLLRSMGWETANLHGAGGARRILADLRRRPGTWLQDAVGAMSNALIRDWTDWRSR